MKIIISNNIEIPIYEQIKNIIISQIMTDELSLAEALPSIRTLAKDIKISVMTIKKLKNTYLKLLKIGIKKMRKLQKFL